MSAAGTATTATPEDANVLSLRDELELRRHFGMNPPSAPGTQSGFGAMCERIGNSVNPKTKERPSPDAPWTDILDCSGDHGGGNFNHTEDAMIAYLDGRRCSARMNKVIARLTPADREVLEAHYSREAPRAGPLRGLGAVAALVPSASRENRTRAMANLHETVEHTLAEIVTEAKDGRKPQVVREAARSKLDSIRHEAIALLGQARASYARARAAEGGRG